MAQYTVPFITTASSAVTVEADNPAEALEKAYEEFDYPDTNIHCAFELDGEWEACVDSLIIQRSEDKTREELFEDYITRH